MSWASIISTWVEPWSLSCAVSPTMICRARLHSWHLSALLKLLCTLSLLLTGCASDTTSGMFVRISQSSAYPPTGENARISRKASFLIGNKASLCRSRINCAHTGVRQRAKRSKFTGREKSDRLWNRNECRRKFTLLAEQSRLSGTRGAIRETPAFCWAERTNALLHLDSLFSAEDASNRHTISVLLVWIQTLDTASLLCGNHLKKTPSYPFKTLY